MQSKINSNKKKTLRRQKQEQTVTQILFSSNKEQTKQKLSFIPDRSHTGTKVREALRIAAPLQKNERGRVTLLTI